MELTTYLQIITRRKLIVALTVLAALIGLAVGQWLIPRVYEANTVLRIIPYSAGEPPYTQLIYANRIMNTYVEIATSGPFLDALRQELGLDEDRPGDVKAGIVPETELLNITVEDSDPFLARDAANALSVMIISENPMRDIKITVVDPAVLPESASSMRMILTIILVVLIGLIGGTGLAFLIENLDPRLQTAEQIVEVTGLPVIGQIPDTGPMQQGKFLIDENPHMDSFRRLRINLLNITKEKGLKTLLVTSSQPDEGKSTIAVNLAICLAQTDLKLLLMDADLHKPMIHTYFDLQNDTGFSSSILSSTSLLSSIQKSSVRGLDVLSSGPLISDPTEVFKENKIIPIFTELKTKYDFILVDAPAFLGVADAAQLTDILDGVILVARRGVIKKYNLRVTYHQLNLVENKVLGVVVNNCEVKIPSDYYKYYEYKRSVQNEQPAEEDIDAHDETPAERPLADSL